MSQSFGYAGKILRVDLTSGNITESPTSDYADRTNPFGPIGYHGNVPEAYPRVSDQSTTRSSRS